ncbi:MAG TPA: flagellar filament capping protein FliD [Polyangiaceae bacterium]|nr:flagellar filament capping protein FliD [Polyangiaceae bacterium]
MPAVTFGGVGSGIDTEKIISGLISASQGPLQQAQLAQAQTQAAISSVSDIGNLLSRLKDSLNALDTSQEVGSFKASSDNKAVAVSATGNAKPGSFKIEVANLATAYKAYSDTLGVTQSNQALHQSGTLRLQIGDKAQDIEIADGDSLDTVIGKINASGLRVSASAFFDGNEFRMQLRGLDTGTENDLLVTETGTTLGFANNVQSNGKNAELTIDGFAVTSKSNQVTGAIAGVTLALTAKTAAGEAATVTIDSDPDALAGKLNSLVSAYNAVVNRIHSEAGFGSIKASNPVLAGDSSLRAITGRLNDMLTKQIGSGKFQTLRSIGLQLNNDGTLKLDSAKLNTALQQDPDAVTKIIAGDDKDVKGVADLMLSVTNDLVSAKGALTARKDGLAARAKLLADRAATEQKRLDQMEEQLRKQFTQMDSIVATNNAQVSFLQSRG